MSTARLVDPDQDSARELVRLIVAQTGLPPSEIARRAGLAPSTITRIFPIPSVNYTLSARSLGKLHKAFPRFSIAWAQDDASEPAAGGGLRQEYSVFHAQAAGGLPLYQLSVRTERQPARGTDMLEHLSGDLEQPIGRHATPWRSNAANRYFLIYMPSAAMEPRFRSGETLLVDRIKPAAAMSDVLVEARAADGAASFVIAMLIDRDRNHLRLRQHRYELEGTIHRRDVSNCFAIVGRFDEEVII